MAQRPDGKPAGRPDRVAFTRPAAERIARAVRKVEAGNRDGAGLSFPFVESSPPAKVFRLGTYTGAWPINTTKTVTFATQTSTPNTITVQNLFVDLQHGTCTATTWKCGVAKEGTAWSLISWQQDTATAIFLSTIADTVVLRDVTLAFNTANCSITKTNHTVLITVITGTFTDTMFTLPQC